jgi:hypothetical protein
MQSTEVEEDMPREIYAWIAEDLDGEECIVMVPDANHHDAPMPLVSIKERMARVGRLFLASNGAAQKSRTPLRLVRYVEAEVLDTIEP